MADEDRDEAAEAADDEAGSESDDATADEQNTSAADEHEGATSDEPDEPTSDEQDDGTANEPNEMSADEQDDASAGKQDDSSEERDKSVDAMGQDKYRTVIGGQYGASIRKRLLIYGSVLAVIVVIVVVSLTVVRNYDGREMPLKDTGPWTEAGAKQATPRDDDFPRNGPTNTIKRSKIRNP